MQKNISRSSIAIAISSSLFLTSCTEKLTSDATTEVTSKFVEQPRVIKVNSLQELELLFDELHYGGDEWNTEGYEIPQISFQNLSDIWASNAHTLPVETKNSLFFRLMAPLILASNENILAERNVVETAPLTSNKLINIALKYKVVSERKILLTESHRQTLLAHVDTLPVSLALVQSAKESGWGTSRPTRERNAFFGQWDVERNLIHTPPSPEDAIHYGVTRYNTPLDSVEAYMYHLNTHSSYNNLRQLRHTLKSKDQTVSGCKLASSLTSSSKNGEQYTQQLREMIQYNKLQATDSMILDDDNFVHLISGNNNVNKLIIFNEW